MHPLIFLLASLATLYKYIVWGISHVGLWSLMLLSAFGAGSVLLRKCHFHTLLERIVFTLALGMGLWALALFVLGLCGALYGGVIWGLTIASALATVFYLIQKERGAGSEWLASLSSLSGLSWKERLHPQRLLVFGVAAVALAYAGLLLLATQYPPLHWDAVAGHLVLARQYLIEHRVVPLRSGAFPLLPALNHMLFSWALALKDDILAQMVEYTFLMLTALGLFTWGQRQERPGLGLAAAALWLSHPLVLWLGESAYVDVGVACFAFLGVYALRVFWDKQGSGEWGVGNGEWGIWWLLAAAFFGMAAGTKMPALFFVGACAVLSLWARIRSRVTWRELMLGWGILILVTVPWYGFIAYHTSNPVWPMFPQFTRREWVMSTQESFSNLVGGGGLPKTLLNFFQLPFYLGLRPNLFFPDNHRDFTPVIALLPLAWIIAIWNRSVRWWSLWILAYTAYWFTFASFMRYWLPVLPLAGLALYEGVGWVLGKVSKSAVIHNAVWVVLTGLAIGYALPMARRDLINKGRLPVDEESRRAFLTRLSPGFRGVNYINRHAQPGDTACVFNGYYLIYHVQPVVTNLMKAGSDQNPAASTLIWPKGSMWMDWLHEKNTTWLLVQHAGLNLPEQSPFDHPGGPSYELVYSGAGAYVWRRTPLPAALSRDAAALKQRDPCVVQGSASGEAPPAYDGFHDVATCSSIEGWAWDANQPNCPVNVNIYDGETLLATVPADRLRDDLAQAGKGNGRHGFKYDLPDQTIMQMRDGQPHKIRVAIAVSEFALRKTPQSIQCLSMLGAPKN